MDHLRRRFFGELVEKSRWVAQRGCNQEDMSDDDDETDSLGFDSLLFCFCVVAVGCVFSSIIAVLEKVLFILQRTPAEARPSMNGAR